MCGSGFTRGSSREHGCGSWKCVFIFLGICWIINWRFTVILVIFRQLPKGKSERLSILDLFFWNQLNYCSQNSWGARDSWRCRWRWSRWFGQDRNESFFSVLALHHFQFVKWQPTTGYFFNHVLLEISWMMEIIFFKYENKVYNIHIFAQKQP